MIYEVITFAEHNQGFITSKQATAAGIPRRLLTEAVEKGMLTKVEKGIYATTDTWVDEYHITQLKFNKGIYSHESALVLLGYSDKIPDNIVMTFPHGYNSTSAKAQGIQVKTIQKDLLGLGKLQITTPYGNSVSAYNIERSLCDLLRATKSPDFQIFNPALRSYLSTPDCNISLLLDYAEKLHVYKKIYPMLEVLS